MSPRTPDSPTRGRAAKPTFQAKLFTASAATDASRDAPPPRISPLKPSSVYDTYWRFAAERQNIFFRRLASSPPPWTRDPILQDYRFTNVYRASDRVSQWLIRHVIYPDAEDSSPDEILFRILLFKTFNRIETWNLLKGALGSISFKEFNFKRYDRILTDAQARGEAIYSAAYIMPSAGSFGHTKKHRNHLTLVEKMIRDGLARHLKSCSSMQAAFDALQLYPTIGPFLAYQYLVDINYSPLVSFSEMEFVVAGPGAISGIRKCFEDTCGLGDAEIIRFMVDRQEAEFERLGLNFQTLWGRRLQLIDCQNLFCEVDKYARVRHPDVSGVASRTRIKQKFQPTTGPLSQWYPPKWAINENIQRFPLGVPDTGPNPLLDVRTPMDIGAYQKAATKTDQNPAQGEDDVIIPLLGLAGEAGDLLTEFKKKLRDGEAHTRFQEYFSENIGDILWYLASVATKLGLDLNEIARSNLKKCAERWGPLPTRTPFDAGFPDGERLPRRFLIDVATTHDEHEKPIVRLFYKAGKFGDPLTDNAHVRNGYGYHDALHLAFAAVLGWSPVTRKLLGAKRKSKPTIDEVEDGARAIATEEGISAMIFAYAKDCNWLVGRPSVGGEILRIIRNMVSEFEVSVCTAGEWERAIISGFAAWRVLNQRGGGTLIVDLDSRTLTMKE